ncbi:helix-turn-helix domain-containing protein [Roseicella aerolata]|uniref:Helix-turn-helix domain-containing protein n=1 Tax=Roseicella aerolata TaxID=2883479 RepID=A0A9X1ICC8_9PROT|nr:helix-turn-helix domain-containing protein [Roseicella aerolata]MCB4820753.1 helix-turn-helix domain-containing protein [Roseicella aerolata]
MHLAETTAGRPSAPQRSTAPAPLSYTLNDACRVSGLSRATLYRHGAAGKLRLLKVGGRTLVCAASLRALLGVAE